jgi:hypothetical protein
MKQSSHRFSAPIYKIWMMGYANVQAACKALLIQRAWLCVILLFCLSSQQSLRAQTNQARDETSTNVVVCRVLETHTSTNPAVTVVVFHQRNKQDQARLGALLRQNDGADVEVQVANAEWRKAVVERLRSCFGRGLLILPANATAPRDGEAFIVKFPPSKAVH